MVEENNKYKQLSDERLDDIGSKTAFRMKSARTETDKYYRNLVFHLEYLMVAGQKTDLLDKLITDLNNLVKHYKNILAQQQGKNKKDDSATQSAQNE
jgi:hypothetical protein